MIMMNQRKESQLYDQIMHETLTTLTIVSARLQLLRKRITTSSDPREVPVERSLRDAERLIAERAGRIHMLATRLTSLSSDSGPTAG
jgi:hypothetical protein